MAKKRNDIEFRPWAGIPRALPLKYHPMAVIPGRLVEGDTGQWEYELDDGVRVRFEYVRTCDNVGGWADESWDKTCRELYGMSFEQVSTAWYRRIGILDSYWHKVKMIKL